jgi:enamine deaminase RidA (YjgF/YER057c/UK114 family)
MRQSEIAIALVAFVCAGTKPSGNYSQGILIDGTLYISGQGGKDAAGKIPSDFDAEVRQSLDNIEPF